jgi:hypothetical protein
MLAITGLTISQDAVHAAGALHRGGVRRLILSGDHDFAAPFLAAGLIDRVLAYLPDGRASWVPEIPAAWPLLPPGYEITSVTHLTGFVRIEAAPRMR